MSPLRIAARIAARELRGGLGGFRVFLACLALGVAAIAAVGTVREGIGRGLEREGATILGGDVQLEVPYRFATEAERAWMAAQGTVSEIVDFNSMAVAGEGRALTEVKAVDAAYPLLGSVGLAPGMDLAAAFEGRDGRPGAVVDRVLAARLDLAPGDTLRLGSTAFVVSAILEREPDSAVSGFDIAPRTLVRSAALEGSGLLAEGSMFETEYRLRVPPGTDLDALRAEADATLDEGVSWTDRRSGASGTERMIERLAAFLVLTGLAGLAVGGVGVSAAVRAYLEGKVATIATLKTLGASGRVIFLSYFLQIGALSLLGVALGLALGAGVPLLLAPLIEARLPVPAELALYPGPLAEAALYGLLTALLFTLWPLARTERVRAAALFRDIAGQGGRPRPIWIAATLAILATLVGAAAWLSGLEGLTLWAAAGTIGAFVVLLGAAWAVRRLARRLARAQALRGVPTLRLALAAVGGPGAETASVVLSLGLGLSVLAAVGQIDANLRGAIERELPARAPTFFVLDIQPDQLAGVLDRLEGDPEVSHVATAPMLRGVITEINGRPAREVGGDHWALRGDRGVTYSAAPPPDTVLMAGEWWPEDYTGTPQVSVAAEEAAEIGLKLGDTLTVDILGRPITAEITSFRDVDFGTLGIGFVLAMNPGAVQGAPHTSIATIDAAPEAEGAILRDLSEAYPNITLIAVRDAIARVGEILRGVAAAVTYGAAATLVTGAVVLVGAAAASERARTYEAAVLKTLGATRGTVLANFALRSAILGAAAGLVAIVAGGLAGWAVTVFVMETTFRFAAGSALAIVLGGVAATLLAGLAFAWRPLAARPARVLRARE